MTAVEVLRIIAVMVIFAAGGFLVLALIASWIEEERAQAKLSPECEQFRAESLAQAEAIERAIREGRRFVGPSGLTTEHFGL